MSVENIVADSSTWGALSSGWRQRRPWSGTRPNFRCSPAVRRFAFGVTLTTERRESSDDSVSYEGRDRMRATAFAGDSQQYNMPSGKSIGPNPDPDGQCQYDTQCPCRFSLRPGIQGTSAVRRTPCQASIAACSMRARANAAAAILLLLNEREQPFTVSCRLGIAVRRRCRAGQKKLRYECEPARESVKHVRSPWASYWGETEAAEG